MWLDLAAKGCLLFTNSYVIIFIVLLGYLNYTPRISRIWAGDRAASPMSVVTYVTEGETRRATHPKLERRGVYGKEIFGRTLFILLFVMVFNAYLKSLWQIPLPPSLGKGWAFPSGHMSAACAFWGWLAIEIRSAQVGCFVLVLLSGIGVSLVHLGYHSPQDILGSVFFTTLSFAFYGLLLRFGHFTKGRLPLIGLILALLCLGLILLLPVCNDFVYVSLGGLVGFSLGWFGALRYLEGSSRRLLLTCVALGGCVAIFGAASLVKPLLPLPLFNFLAYSILAFWISFGVEALVTRYDRYVHFTSV